MESMNDTKRRIKMKLRETLFLSCIIKAQSDFKIFEKNFKDFTDTFTLFEYLSDTLNVLYSPEGRCVNETKLQHAIAGRVIIHRVNKYFRNRIENHLIDPFDMSLHIVECNRRILEGWIQLMMKLENKTFVVKYELSAYPDYTDLVNIKYEEINHEKFDIFLLDKPIIVPSTKPGESRTVVITDPRLDPLSGVTEVVVVQPPPKPSWKIRYIHCCLLLQRNFFELKINV
jgi:hypothetical protein